MSDWRAWIERVLPWYQPAVERRRDALTARIVRRSEEARERAGRVIDEYQQAEAVASNAGERAGQVVTEFRDAQQEAKEAGERLIDEVEQQ